MKKLISLLLALSVLLACGCAFAEDYSLWSQWPVADGDVTVKIVVPQNSSYGVAADETWFWPFFSEATGLDFEVTQILDSAVSEQKTLLYASGELPDVIWGISHSTDELVQYGVEEGLLLDMSAYLNEDVMPNLMKLIEYYPDITSYITASDGGVYTLCWVWDAPYGEETRSFISETRMAEAGVTAVPQTLDEFTEMLYAMKDAASEEDFIPLGGSWSAFSPIYYILNAMGFLSSGYNNGTDISVRNGHAVIPATDDLFYEVLNLLKQYYADGILDPDFFSIDDTIVNAKCAENKLGVYPYVPMITRPDDKEWEATWSSVAPLTSEWNDTKAWTAYNPIAIGGFVMSANCKNPELILRAFDALFSYEGHYLAWEGPIYGTEFANEQGVGGRAYYYDEDGYIEGNFFNANGEHVEGNEYRYSITSGVAAYSLGNYQVWFEDPGNEAAYPCSELGIEYKAREYTYESYEGETFTLVNCSEDWRASMYHTLSDYTVTAYPSVVYRSVDNSLRITELESVLNPYMESAIAQFIVGDRPLNEEEFNRYLQEIEDMGASELNAIYDSYYQLYLSNLG